MLLEIAIGDAYGNPYEFAPIDYIAANNDGLTYRSRDSKHGIRGGGEYTDDTQMSLAVAETILSEPQYLKPATFASGFINAYKREIPYRTGYGSRIRVVLTNTNSGPEFISEVTEPHSSSNGCVMRVLPCGILSNPEMVQNAAISQCMASHLHHDAVDASRILALVAHSSIYNGDIGFEQHVYWALKECGFDIEHKVIDYHKQFDEIPVDAMATVGAVFDVINRSYDYVDVLKNSIAFGGDVDSVAALAMGLASLTPHINKTIPISLYGGLEDGTFGRGYCQALDNRIESFISKKQKV